MTEAKRRASLGIWALGAGYFLFYAPYSALTKAASSGLLGSTGPLSAYEVLPASAIGNIVGMVIAMTAMGWWKHLGRRRVLGATLPMPSGLTLLSALCTAVIIGATTLAYSLSGATIVFVMLLLRGGVLILAPIIDLSCQRKVHWTSLTGLLLSLASVSVAVVGTSDRGLTLAVAVDVIAYLGGYLVRLEIMSRKAKSPDSQMNLRYFAEEQAFASPILLALCVLFAAIGRGEVMGGLRHGLTGFLATSGAFWAFGIGLLYSGLYVFGTLIYLDARENTFCIPVNRASSLLAGVVASYGLAIAFGAAPPNVDQIASAGVMLLAIGVLAGPAIAPRAHALGERLIIFVCSGNTCRSPMAEAIGLAEIARRLGLPPEEAHLAPVKVLSAGTSAKVGAPRTQEADQALTALGVPTPPHRARALTLELVDRAEAIYCATGDHRRAVLALAPHAENKTHCLDPGGDIPDPIGAAFEVYMRTAEIIRDAIRRRFDELALGSRR